MGSKTDAQRNKENTGLGKTDTVLKASTLKTELQINTAIIDHQVRLGY